MSETNGPSDGAAIVARELAKLRPSERPAFLRDLLKHTAAGIVVIEGDREAAEAVYLLADAIVGRR